jgi:catechol 2,3-dioxygenase-like lactoylglutathione lyase family enzyme
VEADLRDVLARIGPGFFQQAFVVADLAAARDAFTAVAGCETWATLAATSAPFRYRGRAVECAVGISFGRSGSVQIELLHPESGEGIHVEFLERHGPGAHHFGYLVDSLDAEMEVAAAAGFDEAFAGEFGSLRFAYLDTYDTLGVYLELVEDPDGMMQQLMPWR